MQTVPQLLMFFYRKITTRHAAKIILLRKFQTLLQRINKIEEVQNRDQHYPSTKKQQDDSSSSKRIQNNFEHQILKRGEQQWGCQWKFSTSSFERNLLFAVLNRLILAEDFLCFKCMEEKLNLKLEQSQLDLNIIHIISYEWLKIGQILVNKKRLRWQKLLFQSVLKIPIEFDLLFQQIFDIKGKQQDRACQLLSQISGMFKIKIVYYQLEGRTILKSEKFGVAQDEIYVCYLHDICKYTVCNKPPQLSYIRKMKQKALTELRLGFSSLLQQYHEGTLRMGQLTSLKGIKMNQGKVLAHLNKN